MIIIGILLFASLVVVHELGHFIAARRAGVEVLEFGIGFPPRLWKRKAKSGTLYTLNLIPLGGFVKLKGEDSDSREPGSFGATSYKKKVVIILAGVVMNVVAAFVLVLILCFKGLPNMIDNQFSVRSDEKAKTSQVLVVEVLKDSPAAALGLTKGSVVTSVNDQTITDASVLVDYLKDRPEQDVRVGYLQKGTAKEALVKLARSDEGKGQLGVVPFTNTTVRYGWSAPIVAAGVTSQLVWLTIVGLAQLVVGLITQGSSAPAAAGVAGPISIFALLQGASSFGLSYLLLLIISISVSLAVINSLPIPALDGGRLALISAYKALKKPLSGKVEATVHGIGFALLMLLVIIISIADVRKLL